LHRRSRAASLRLVTTVPTSPKRRVVSLSLTARGERVVTRSKAETGITQVALMERLLEWFGAQDPRIRTMILSPYPQVRRGLARLVVEEMQADPRRDFDSLPHFDALIDHDFGGALPPTEESRRPGAASARRISKKSRS
jgi:hypothetical protein